MSTIEGILSPEPDGTIHLPLPPELRHGKVRVTAIVELAESKGLSPQVQLRGFGCLKGKMKISPDFDEPLEDFREYIE